MVGGIAPINAMTIACHAVIVRTVGPKSMLPVMSLMDT
jgi:hypothetical protein